MRRQELYINGELVDLPGENALPVRFKTVVSDSNNPDTRGGTFTYTIRLPLTARNAQVFEHIDDLQVIDTFNRGYDYQVDYFVDSFPELSGRLVVRGVAPGEYVEGEIYSDDIAWATQIDAKSLRDIKSLPVVPFTGVFSTHNFNHYLALGIDDSPLQFPMVSYGNYFYGLASEGVVSNQVYEQAFDDFPPAAYYLRVFKAIFQDIGWTVKGKIFDDPQARTHVLPYVGQSAFRWNWRTMGYAEATHRHDTGFSSVQDYAQTWGLSEPAPGELVGYYTYTAKTNEHYQATLSVTFTNPEGSSVIVRLEFIANDPTGNEVGYAYQDFALDQVDQTFTLSAPFDLNTGDKVKFKFPNTYLYRASLKMELPLADEHINVAANLPDMNQKTFVKSLISFYNLFFDASAENKVITFYQEPDYYKEADFAVSLDDVVVASKAVKRPPKVFRRQDFIYTPDGDDALVKASPDFANLRLTNSSPAAQGQSAVTVPFAPTAYREYRAQPGNVLLSLPTLADQDALSTPLNEVDWRYNYVPRIIKFLGPAAVPFLINGQASNVGLSEFPAALYWKNLYATYYGRPQNPRGHLLEVSGILHRDQYARLRQKWNVLLAGEIYRLESCDGYDPNGQEEAKMILIKQV